MIRSTLKKIVSKLLGQKEKPAPPAARPRPNPPVRPMPSAEERGHDHGHDHGHSHDHGHDHGHAPEPEPEPEDHGHDHGHSHDHGRAPEPVAAKAAAIRVVPSDTPNPNARKFTTSVRVVAEGSVSINTAEEAQAHAFGRALWGLPGVRGVFAVNDFVTVTKDDAAEWDALTPKVIEALAGSLG